MEKSIQISTALKCKRRFSICLLVVLLDSVISRITDYYPALSLEECKQVVKEKKIPKYIIDDIEISDSDRENSDEENSDKGKCNEENSDKEN